MSKLLRYFEPHQFCFITSVTKSRRPLLVTHADKLAIAVKRAHVRSRFRMVAWVILPDHVHALMNCPNGDTARIVQQIKLSFSLQLRHALKTTGPVWQHRYWDHVIRDSDDLRRHIHYVHYNPVKHGIAKTPIEWPLSSFGRFVVRGLYTADWGVSSQVSAIGEYGE
ncbi:transposase [bacterium]|nr:transposase [bacterium]